MEMGSARRALVLCLAVSACLVLVCPASVPSANGAGQRVEATGERAETAMGSRVILENVDRYRVQEPLFEGVRAILSYRGEEHSPAYVQGISGAAFRIGGPCPCAPTCEWAMSTDALIHLLGYEYERLEVPAEGLEREAKMGEMIARTGWDFHSCIS